MIIQEKLFTLEKLYEKFTYRDTHSNSQSYEEFPKHFQHFTDLFKKKTTLQAEPFRDEVTVKYSNVCELHLKERFSGERVHR